MARIRSAFVTEFGLRARRAAGVDLEYRRPA